MSTEKIQTSLESLPEQKIFPSEQTEVISQYQINKDTCPLFNHHIPQIKNTKNTQDLQTIGTAIQSLFSAANKPFFIQAIDPTDCYQPPKIQAHISSNLESDCPEDNVSAFIEKVNSLDFSSFPDSTVLYTQSINQNFAIKWAGEHNKITIENTAGGKVLHGTEELNGCSTPQRTIAWHRPSELFATHISGNVDIIAICENAPKPNSTLLNVELPILLKNSSVKDITLHCRPICTVSNIDVEALPTQGSLIREPASSSASRLLPFENLNMSLMLGAVMLHLIKTTYGWITSESKEKTTVLSKTEREKLNLTLEKIEKKLKAIRSFIKKEKNKDLWLWATHACEEHFYSLSDFKKCSQIKSGDIEEFKITIDEFENEIREELSHLRQISKFSCSKIIDQVGLFSHNTPKNVTPPDFNLMPAESCRKFIK